MTRTRTVFLALSLLVLLPIATGTLAFARSQDEGDASDSEYKYITVFLETLNLIRRNYVEEVDLETLITGALHGSADALDPFSTYVPAAELDAYQKVRAIGDRHSGLVAAKERGITYVVGVAPESPADSAGLKFGDVISRIGAESSRTMPLWRLQSLLANKPGAELDLEILRQGQQEEAKLVLGEYSEAPAAVERQKGVPVLRLSRLSEQVGSVRQHLSQLSGAGEKQLIVDLRGTGAAEEAEAAYEIGRLFASGEVGKLMRRDEVVETFEVSEAPVWTGKVVVLIDRGTMGPAEVLAGMLRDLVEADLVGERTFGYAGRQSRITLSGGSGLFYTDAFYATPAGETIDEGLTPDVVVSINPFAVRDDAADEEEGADPILDRGLEVMLSDEEPEALPKAA